MKTTVKTLLGTGCLVSCLALPVGAMATTIVNGGFETGDYTGWGLFEGGLSNVATFGTWGIVTDGQTVNPGDALFDFFDGVNVDQTSPGLPRTHNTLDGSNFMAVQYQNGGQFHRAVNQVIALDVGAQTLEWDMFYQDHSGGFVVNNDPLNDLGQFLAIRLYDALGITLLDTAFITNPGDAPSIGMTHFSHDISALAGQSVTLAIEMDVDNFYLDAGFDNFQVIDANVPEPSSLAIFALALAGMGYSRKKTAG